MPSNRKPPKGKNRRLLRSRVRKPATAGLALAPLPVAIGPIVLEQPGATNRYVVQGTVLYSDGSPARGLQVGAYDEDTRGADELGKANTNDKGQYFIEYHSSAFRKSANELRGPDVFVRLFAPGNEVPLFESAPRRNAPQEFVFDFTAPDTEWMVRGIVTDTRNRPVSGLIVRVLDKDLRKEQLLFETATREDGSWSGRYGPRQYSLAERGHADLAVRVYASDRDSNSPLAERTVIEVIGPVVTVNLTVDTKAEPPSEYEAYENAITPLLAGQGEGGTALKLMDLAISDTQFLAREASLEFDKVGQFIVAQSLARHFAADERREMAIPAELFYALIRAGLGGTKEALAVHPRSSFETALQWSMDRRITPNRLQKSLPSLLGEWDRLRAPLAAAAAPRQGVLPTNAVFEMLGSRIAPALRERVWVIAARDGELHEGIGDELSKIKSLSGAERESLPALRKALTFAGLAQGDQSLYNGLMTVAQKIPKLTRQADIVKLSRADWVKVAEAMLPAKDVERVPGAALEERASNLMRRFDSVFLGEAAALRMASGEITLSKTAKSAWKALAKKHEGLQLGSSGDQTVVSALRANSQQEKVSAPAAFELLKLDALLRVTGSSQDVADLQNAGYLSVEDVTNRGLAAFVASMTGASTSAAKVERKAKTAKAELKVQTSRAKRKSPAKIDFPKSRWTEDRAKETYVKLVKAKDNANLVTVELQTSKANPTLSALNQSQTSASASTLSDLAFDRRLCACESCRSVLSQSAYLADQLDFLRDATPTNGASPLDVLMKRRPDIQEVLLACANERTEVSYVDLVNEILERAVAEHANQDWLLLAPNTAGATFVAELNGGTLPQVLRTELTTAGIRLSSQSSVETDIPGVRWRLRDERWVVTLFNRSLINPPQLGIRASPWPQSTHANPTSAEVEPVRLMAAYQELSEAVYPWHLPFDLAQTITRTILAARRIDEDDFLRTFAAGSVADAAAAAAVAKLHFTRLDVQALFSNSDLDETETAARWGFDDINLQVPDPRPSAAATAPKLSGWKAIASRLSFFVERSGLSFDEVRALLATDTINSNGRLGVVPVNSADPDTCDLRALAIRNLTDRRQFLTIYRFVRLARAAEVSFADLDRLLGAFWKGAWDKTLLQNVALALAMGKRLELPIDRMAVFWGDISTRSYFDLMADPPRQTSSQFDKLFRLSPELAALLPQDPTATAGWPRFLALEFGLCRALNIRPDEYEVWLEVSGLTTSEIASVGKLSAIYRNVILAQINNASANEYRTFLSLQAEKPFANPVSSTSVDRVERFLQRWAFYRSLAVPIETLFSALRVDASTTTSVNVEILNTARALQESLSTLWDQAGVSQQQIKEQAASRQQTIVQAISNLTGFAATDASELGNVFLQPPKTSTVAVVAFLNDRRNWPAPTGQPPVAPAITVGNGGDVLNALLLVKKVSILLNALGARSSEHWRWIFGFRSKGLWINLTSLPVKVGDPEPSFEKLSRLGSWVQFWASRSTPPKRVWQLLASTAQGLREAKGAIASEFPIELADLSVLLGKFWAPTDSSDFWEPALWLRIQTAANYMGILKIDAGRLCSWIDPRAPSFAQALSIAEQFKTAALASMEAEDASPLLAKYKLVMRSECKAALVSYLMHREAATSTGILFEKYLIDVEMSPEQPSTRIAQAVFATQLFVQRILLNLEPDALLNESEAKEWNQWRKWYRVWEANRKVFLYPENWVEPQFRDNKSAFYKDLESELQQSDLTSARAVDAFGNYLDKLGQVSRIEIVSILNARDNNRLITHIFARTRHGPATYYYRQRVKDSFWTAWEKIDADVEGDFLIPVLTGKRLQLLWVVMSEDPPEAEDTSAPWKLQFMRSRRTATGWKSKELLGAPILQPRLPGKEARDSFCFRTSEDASGNVTVHAFSAAEKPVAIPPPPTDDFILRIKNNLDPCYVHLLLRYQARPDIGVSGVEVTFTRSLYVPQPIEIKLSSNSAGSVDIVWALINDPIKDKFPLTMSFTKDGQSLNWYFGGNRVGNYAFGKDLLLDLNQYTRITIPILLDLAPPTTPADPARPIDWVSIAGILCTPSGAVQQTAPDATVALAPPTNSVHRGMGYQPIANEMHFSSDPASRSVISCNARAVCCFGSVHGSGIRTITTPAGFGSRHPDLNFDDVTALSIDDQSYIGDLTLTKTRIASQKARYRFGGLLTLTPLFFPSDAAVFATWAREQMAGLARPQLQQSLSNNGIPAITKSQAARVSVDVIMEGTEFNYARSSAVYNWEIFFHIPWLVADRLSENKRFAEAQAWYHTIYDPTLGVSSTFDEWRCRPLREALSRGDSLLDLLSDRNRLDEQIRAWEEQPFQPHVLARYRLKAYAIAIMKGYVENLHSWSLNVASRGTMEAINEATQLLVLASNVLGQRTSEPVRRAESSGESFAYLRDFDPLSNPAAVASTPAVTGSGGNAPVPSMNLRYFCIPPNAELLDLWARVESSLLRFRSGTGSLFGPPIDPAILVKASALGLSIEDVVTGLSAPTLPYRYAAVSQRALQFCGEVKALGSGLLSAIEKRDTEQLSALRAKHERTLAKLQRDIRRKQVDESRAQIDALQATRAGAVERLLHFRKLLAQTDMTKPAARVVIPRIEPISQRSSESHFDVDVRQLGLSRREVAHLNWSTVANNYSLTASTISAIAAIGHFFPNWSWQVTVPPVPPVSMSYGGSNIGQGMSAISTVFQALSANAGFQASTSATLGSHERRRDDWAYQHNVVAGEIEQLDKQIAGAELRREIAEAEFYYQVTVLKQNQETEQYLRDKFSSVDLYHWMIRQLSSFYFRSYQVALELAKAAQTSFDRELVPESKSQFIQPVYWDNLREGLLCAEHLALDLMRMESEYLRTNRRELELTKSVSLASIDPLALIYLRLTGVCTFKLPEVIFDLDFPGHYLRRIKSVAVSLPCVVGPFTSVAGTLTLKKSFTRMKDLPSGALSEDSAPPVTTSIAISSAQADAGLFETNLRDERYLPFEGAGIADSEWEFSLPREFRPFDYETISDLVLQVRYTSRAGNASHVSSALKGELNALKAVGESNTGLWRAFSLRHEFPGLWNALSDSPSPQAVLSLDSQRFGVILRDSTLNIEELRSFALLRGSTSVNLVKLELAYGPSSRRTSVTLTMDQNVAGATGSLRGSASILDTRKLKVAATPVPLSAQLKEPQSRESIEDIYLCARFTVEK